MTALSATFSNMTTALEKALNRIDLSEAISRQADTFAAETYPNADTSIVPVDNTGVEIIIERRETGEAFR